MVCAPPFHSTVPVLAVNVPPVPLTLPPIFNVLDPPSSVPFVLVQAPVIVCVNPEPRFNVPPAVLFLSEPAFIFPVNVATPLDLLHVTWPVVVKPAMLCVAVPPIVMAELPAVNVPLLVKSPFSVTPQLDVESVPLPMVKLLPTVRAAARVALAVPPREKLPLMVATLVIVFAPLPERVKFL